MSIRDVIERMERADQTLLEMVEIEERLANYDAERVARLKGKAEGVRLALGYLREEIRE